MNEKSDGLFINNAMTTPLDNLEDINPKRKIPLTDTLEASSSQRKNDYFQNKPKMHYSEKDSGSFGVWIKKINLEGSELNAYKVGSILYKDYPNIVDIRKRGKYNVEVMCKNYIDANAIIDDVNLKKHGLETFVPVYKKFRQGIVKNIPVDISEQSILNACESPAKVMDVRRLNRRNTNSTSDSDRWIPSKTILITFEGQMLPSEIIILKVNTEVIPYVKKPMQCFKCFEFGHTIQNCKNEAFCIQCGEKKHENGCLEQTPKCVNCQGDHKSIDSVCPIFQKHHKINVIMAFDNISYFEAKKLIFGTNYTPKDIRKTKENFPKLREKNLNKYSNHNSYSRIIQEPEEATNNVNDKQIIPDSQSSVMSVESLPNSQDSSPKKKKSKSQKNKDKYEEKNFYSGLNIVKDKMTSNENAAANTNVKINKDNLSSTIDKLSSRFTPYHKASVKDKKKK